MCPGCFATRSSHALQPRAHFWIRREIQMSFMGHVRIRIEGDIRDGVTLAHEVRVIFQMRLHHRERGSPLLEPLGQFCLPG